MLYFHVVVIIVEIHAHLESTHWVNRRVVPSVPAVIIVQLLYHRPSDAGLAITRMDWLPIAHNVKLALNVQIPVVSRSCYLARAICTLNFSVFLFLFLLYCFK